jgi:hypothetical protein
MENPVPFSDNEVPKTMAQALDWEDPASALRKLSISSGKKAETLALELARQLNTKQPAFSPTTCNDTLTASTDSINHVLTKIASGGSQASQEIRTLEEEKRELERHAQDVETALVLRTICQELRQDNLKQAALAIQEYNKLQRLERLTPRALAYAGESSTNQVTLSSQSLQTNLLQRYETAVDQSNLQVLGELTPLLQMVQLEQQGVKLYLRYLTKHIETEWNQKKEADITHMQMARIYNSAVSTLRHHLPMLSHCLYKADGDVVLVQLVHAQVEVYVIPLLSQYIRDSQLHTISHHAQEIYPKLEEKLIGGLQDDDDDDAGFGTLVGTMSQVNGALEEAALLLQHAESYTRFIQHTISEINKARKLKWQQEKEALQVERERQEWATGKVVSTKVEEFKELEILPAHGQLQEVVAEVGGYYSGIERSLLLASMQRAVHAANDSEAAYPYSPLGMKSHSTSCGTRALKTSLVETCLYAARHGMQRAFATGHTGTAAACANFGSDILASVLLQVMTGRAQELGVAALKPGEGLLLAGSSSSLASNLIRQGQNAVVGGAVVIGGGQQVMNEAKRQEHVQQGIAKACATLNDLEVAVHHTKHLERLLMEAIEKGYPPHDAEQLRMCVKSLGPVADSFLAASDGAVDSLLSVLTTRVRSIVNDAVGSEGSAASASFMGSSVMGSHAIPQMTVRMNYNLDDDAYQLLQLSEGFMARMCASLDELIQPLRIHLAPRLSDVMVLGLISLAAKRIESALRRVRYRQLGACTVFSSITWYFLIIFLLVSCCRASLQRWEPSLWILICVTCWPL